MAAARASAQRSSSDDWEQATSCPAPLIDALSGDSLESESDESCDAGLDINMVKETTAKDTKHSSQLRIAKPIRVRVRWSCHRCQGQVDKNKVCLVCQHVRCENCVRDPPSRRNTEETTPPAAEADLMTDVYWNAVANVMQRPSVTGGQDLVHKPPKQVVRRTCHLCQASFERSKKCSRCSHKRCSECPRDPENKKKYPYGYPGDEYGSDATPYYECLVCCEVYAEDAEYGTPCQRCGCGMSRASPRVQPRAVLMKPNAPLLESIQRQLAVAEA